MIIKFGLELEENIFPENMDAHVLNCGENSLLTILESFLGLGAAEKLDFLRVEQYRQTMQQYLNSHDDVFFKKSFLADPLAAAEALLMKRDELLLNDFDFELTDKMPERLRVISALEKGLDLLPNFFHPGYADRFSKVMEYLNEDISIPILEIHLTEPLSLVPPHLQRLFNEISKKGIKIIETAHEIIVEGDSDLSMFKKSLITKGITRTTAKADGSLIILKAGSETYAAAYLSKLFSKNSNFRPLCLISNKNRALDNAMIQDGLPSFGVLSASLSRPTLQILKLAPVFLWTPLNPYKLLEFLSLPNIPLPRGLAFRLAAAVSEKPGLFNNVWFAKKNDFFNDLDAKIEAAEKKEYLIKDKKRAERDYRFWFERKRYDIRNRVPVKDVIDIYEYIRHWALDNIEDLGNRIDKLEKGKGKKKNINKEKEIELLQTQQKPLIALIDQIKKLIILLSSMPEDEKQLSFLQLERVVKSIYEPTQMVFRLSEIGQLPYVYHPAAISGNSKKTLWWNFIDNESNPGFEQWYSNEFDYLNSLQVFPEKTNQKNYRLLWQRKQPVLKTEEQLILVYPDTVNGQAVNAHPLWGDLQACFGKSIDKISFNPEKNLNENLLNSTLSLPDQEKTIVQDFKKAGHFINITQDLGKIEPRKTETFSGLDNLIYYPYQWAFRYLLGLHKSSILSIVRKETLKGNLAHSAFEKIFKETIEKNSTWTKDAVYQWMEKEIPMLIEREAAVMMMYGQEAERRSLINMMKHAAWTLISSIQNNGWQILGTEVPVSGKLGNQDLKGKADLILGKDGEKTVIDLKFSGNDRYRKKIKNREDIQLLIYSRFAAEPENWAHTAYFIISSAKLFAKNNDAFAEAEALLKDEALKAVNNSIWEKLQNTYEWRISQLSEGLIEIRNQTNIQALTDAYEGLNMLDMLELSTQDAFYDIYGVLVGSGIKD